MQESDFGIFKKFAERVTKLGDYAAEQNCKLYVDAEQTFVQGAIESFGQQMTHQLNQGSQAIIMNGYQCYLKRMTKVIQKEVATANKLGYNLGIKLIRGAYMNEERGLAEEQGYESPVWDTIEDTHACYNQSMETIIRGLPDEDSQLFVASHNQETIDLAKNLLDQTNLKDTECVRFGQLQGFSD